MKSKNVVAVIDLKAFYAVVECVERKLDPLKTALVVADKSRGTGTIVLSVSPLLKKLGIPSRCRVYELPKIDNLIYATPRMGLYVKKSAEVVSILLDYVGDDDLHIYSIDEAFINIGPYLKLYKKTPEQLVEDIIATIFKKTGLLAACGIGDNNFLAKSALDHEAKKSPSNIAYWTIDDVQDKLWPIAPLSEMWGISGRLQHHLNMLGIESVGDLANYSRDRLIALFGIMGEQLSNHANGIDQSNIREKYISKTPSLSIGQILFKDYPKDEIPLIIREMCDDLCFRLRLENKLAGLVAISIGYSSMRGGFGRQMSLIRPTDDDDVLYQALLTIFNKHIINQPIRRVGIAFSKLFPLEIEQLDIFVDPRLQDKKRRLSNTITAIKKRYGKNAILRLTSLLESSTTIARHNQIGGHRK
jgi:DNA polymerase V